MSVLYLADTVDIDGTVYPTIGEHIRSVDKDVNSDTNLTVRKDELKICLTVGDNDEYEDYKEQVIIAPPDSAQLKTIHTYYHTTTLSSENEISVEYIADTEAYIENKIKENIN